MSPSRRLPVGYSCLAFSGNAGLHTQGHHQPRPWRSEWIHKILLLLKELVMEMGGWGTWSGGRNPPFVGWQTSLSFYSMCVCSVAQSCLTLCNTMEPAGLLCPWNSPGKNTGVGYHSLLQGIFLTPGPNPGLLHCRQILYHWSQQGSHLLFDAQALRKACRFFRLG